ncbi:MAG: glutaredoxin family protein [Planctomyces sp.]|nr:glutaredoxin family protein [Planctomyces sp.]
MPENQDLSLRAANARVAAGLLVFSLLGLAGCLAGAQNWLPLGPQRMFDRSPFFWSALTFAMLVGSCVLQWKASHARTEWKPATPGRRFRSGVLYTRKDCSLCDEARELLAAYRHWLPPLREIDIDIHPDFRDAFNTCVPVLELDDEIRFRGRISEVLLRRLLQGNAPVEDVPLA